METTKKEKEFSFNGTNNYSYLRLRESKNLKVYAESSHFDRILCEDKDNGDLFLYEFYEYMDFNDGNDEMYETFVLVKDEKDADKLNKERDIRRSPYIRVMPNFDIITKEG